MFPLPRAAFLRLVALGSTALLAPPAAQEAAGAAPAQKAPHDERIDDPPAQPRAADDLAAHSPRRSLELGLAQSLQVNTDANGQNVLGDAANEPSIAVDPLDPDRIVIGWRQFDDVSSNYRQAGYAFSHDGGQSWTAGVLTPGAWRSDPSLGFNAHGDVYYQSLDASFQNQLFKSETGGASWNAPVDAWGGDKNWMTVDNSGGMGDGHVYGTWQRFFGCCGEATLTRSVDDGQSFEQPVVLERRPLFGTMAVGPNGTLYVSGIDGSFGQDFDTWVIARSANAQDPGQTPTSSAVTVDMAGPMRYGTGPNPGGLLGQANALVDHSGGPSRGNVYLVGSSNPAGSDPLDVRCARSTDGGQTWSTPVRVNDDAQGSARWQWFGAGAVAPNGRVDVIWFDTRNSGQANLSELFYAWSYDEGQTWNGNQPVTPLFDSWIGWPNQNKIGDYITIVSEVNGAHVAFAATFNGEQDVYYSRLLPDCTTGGSGSAFCSGDGSGTPCPCSNPGAPGHGCANGQDAAGAQVSACGSASVASGNLQLVTSGAVPGQVGLYFQGALALNGGNGVAFRDGLRCTGSPAVRLEVVTSDFSGGSQSSIDLAAAGGVSAGDTRHYQLWYRDPQTSPCGTGSNLSNGYTVVWAP